MSKRLTINQIQSKIYEIESKYYKGWNKGEEWWLLSGVPDKQDSILWSRYQRLLDKRLKEIKHMQEVEYIDNIKKILIKIDPNSQLTKEENLLEKYWFNQDQEMNVEKLYNYCDGLLLLQNKPLNYFVDYRSKSTPHDICKYIKSSIIFNCH